MRKQVAIFFGVGLLLIGLLYIYGELNYLSGAKSTTATNLGYIEEENDAQGATEELKQIIEFTTEDGQIIQTPFPYTTLQSEEFEIFYSERNPNNIRWDRPLSMWLNEILLVGGGLIIIISQVINTKPLFEFRNYNTYKVIFGGLVAIICFGIAAFTLNRTIRFNFDGVETKATVIGYTENLNDSDNPTRVYSKVIRFTTEDGKVIRTDLKGELQPSDITKGEIVDIYYLENNPYEVSTTRPEDSWLGPIIMIIIGFTIAILIIATPSRPIKLNQL